MACFDGGDRPWGHAQLTNAEADEQGGCGGIGGQLAAYRDPGPRGCRVGDLGDEVQDRGVERIGERGNVGVAALGGERVLGQVVGADAEQVDERSGGPRMEREPGHFSHGADFEPEGQISGGQPNLGGGLGEQGAGRLGARRWW